MATVIRAADHDLGSTGVAFNYEDVTTQARAYLDKVRAEAVKIVAKAQQDAEVIRKQAQQDGWQAAIHAGQQTAQQTVEQQLATVVPALRQAVADIQHAKQTWLAHWEGAGIHVAAAIAQRVIRRELARQPEIPVVLLREALELAAGSSEVRIHLNPGDHKTISEQVQVLLKEFSGMSGAEVLPDAAITPGGCRLETRFGVIDQQIEAQLARIEEELKG
jgi:flagellar assembly protein FliH